MYFAVWVTAVVGMWLFGIQPYLKDRKKAKSEQKTPVSVQKTVSVPSPRSNLPLRDRIREYVAERRKEEGLPVPEPLRPSRSAGPSAARPGSAKTVSSGFAAGVTGAAPAVVSAASSSDEGDLPLPDDFDEHGPGELFGDEFPDEAADDSSLPGIGEDDFGSYDDTGIDERPMTESGDLPDFDGDLEPDMSDSDLSGGMDYAEDGGAVPEMLPDDDGGSGLSDDGLPDLDMPLDDDMMDDSMSGDDDFADIEFEDIEPDEN